MAVMAAEKPAPVRVLYCGVCGLPTEYCEFGPDFERCKPWLRDHAPGVYPDELIASSSSGSGGDVDKVGERLQGVGISDGSRSSVAGDASASKPEEVKRLPGGKVKKKQENYMSTPLFMMVGKNSEELKDITKRLTYLETQLLKNDNNLVRSLEPEFNKHEDASKSAIMAPRGDKRESGTTSAKKGGTEEEKELVVSVLFGNN